jgi:hypothetical protein
MSDAAREDIERVLAICFRGRSSVSAAEMIRILTFDMDWMNDETAADVISSLCSSGWLREIEGELTTQCELKGVTAPLGWQPRPSRLLEKIAPPSLEIEQSTPQQLVIEKPPVAIHVSNDPRAKLERRLCSHIAKSSGVERGEIERRAKRKVLALKYCTSWLALCLVAREQGLEMTDIIESLSAIRTA